MARLVILALSVRDMECDGRKTIYVVLLDWRSGVLLEEMLKLFPMLNPLYPQCRQTGF